ncbi:hypothetical protein DNTS_007091 [Danionella cerebrum]|uniref:LRRCT domain-containing protein n=1 Tax=Danionella cerebrum TaxID=2873325 RepID=A0A553QC88_9TELE|nr:hypothetical protein DNTS_007091 [Danionella translucida]
MSDRNSASHPSQRSGVCILLMVTFGQTELAFLCPPSCLICSGEVIICQKLTSIFEAPGSTKALILTDGLIDSVDDTPFSSISNMSVLVLSYNTITSITGRAFQDLAFLETLSLDHNHISSQSLNSATFSWLLSLETLQLGNNHLREIHGGWFQSSRALKHLQLDGNLLTSLNYTTFAHSNLRNLEMLDLSNNLISYLGQESFQGLPRLRTLDLSRNHLQSAPDAFSYLPWLSSLNLDLNHWSCSCELRELASFLRSFSQTPGRVLSNGKRMVCVSSENLSVQTVEDLTDTNCVPPKSNIPVEVMTRGNNTSQKDLRNFAVAIVFSFLGGVVMTLGVIGIVYHKLSSKIKLLQGEHGVEERSTSSPETAQWKFSEGKDALSMSHALHNSNYKPHQSTTDLENHFTCHKCSTRANQLQDPHHPLSMLQQSIKDEPLQRHKESVSGFSESHPSRQNAASLSHVAPERVSAVRIQQLALTNHFSALKRGTFRSPQQANQGNHKSETTSARPAYQTVSCLHCHETFEYRRAERNNQNFPFEDPSQSPVQRRAQMYDAVLYRDLLGYEHADAKRELGFKLASQRSVTFDLPQPEEMKIRMTAAARQKKECRTIGSRSSVLKCPADANESAKAHHKPQKNRGQKKRTLRVKLNLNPFRKSRVHPKTSDEENKKDKKRKEHSRGKRGERKTSRSYGKKTSRTSKDCVDAVGNKEDETCKTKQSKETEDATEETKPEVETCENPLSQSDRPLELTEEENSLTVTAHGLDLSDALVSSSNATLLLSEDIAEEPESSSSSAVPVIQEYLSSTEGSTKRKLRLILPENPTSQRPQTALDKKIR